MEFTSLVDDETISKNSLDLEYELNKDFSYSSGQILSSMNSEPLARDIFTKYLHTNLGDPALFKGTANIEQYVVRILGELVNLPSEGRGVILTGGSEANVTALWSIRNYKIKNFLDYEATPEIIIPESAHISIEKAANLLGIKVIKVPTTTSYQIDISKVSNSINDNTIAIIGVAGTTAFGTIDPLDELNDVCLSNKLDLHIDAAFGGLVFPFLPEKDRTYNLSFDLKAIKTMTIDIHKMGRVPCPGGGLLWRDKSYPEAIQFTLKYLKGEPKQSTITGTRSGASAIAFAKTWQKCGYNGYQKEVLNCVNLTKFLANELIQRGFNIPIKPIINILGVKTMNDNPININLLHNKLWDRNWTTTIVDGFLRFVIMPPTSKTHIAKLIDVIDEIISEES